MWLSEQWCSRWVQRGRGEALRHARPQQVEGAVRVRHLGPGIRTVLGRDVKAVAETMLWRAWGPLRS